MQNQNEDIFVVINTTFGGFSLNDEEMELYLTESVIPYQTATEKGWGNELNFYDGNGDRLSRYDIPRDDKVLVSLVMGNPEKFEDLAVVRIPAEFANNWTIWEYDGQESVFRADYQIGEYV